MGRRYLAFDICSLKAIAPLTFVTQRSRLRHLVKMLEKVPAKQFDMGTWSWRRTPEDAKDCGMVACIGGHMTQDKWFQERGIRAFSRTNYEPVYSPKRGVTLYGSAAMQAFFGLSAEDVATIFDADAEHKTPKQAIRTIKRIIKKLEKAHG